MIITPEHCSPDTQRLIDIACDVADCPPVHRAALGIHLATMSIRGWSTGLLTDAAQEWIAQMQPPLDISTMDESALDALEDEIASRRHELLSATL